MSEAIPKTGKHEDAIRAIENDISTWRSENKQALAAIARHQEQVDSNKSLVEFGLERLASLQATIQLLRDLQSQKGR